MDKAVPRLLGTRIKRREDPGLITGQARFVADLELPQARHLGLVRSPHGHARIRSIRSREAGRLPGVEGIFTGRDLNPRLAKPLPVIVAAFTGRFREIRTPDRYPLAESVVRHVGDPVAAVVTRDARTAADAVAAIEVDYQPLEAVTEVNTALDAGRPVLHAGLPDNRAYCWQLQEGRPEQVFQEAEVVVEVQAHLPQLIPTALEPRAVAARYDSDSGRFTLWSTTQIPHQLRDDVADMLGVPHTDVRVIAPHVGGGFGAKSNVYPEEVLAPLLARLLGCPIRWTASRREDCVATSHGRGQRDTIRLAADGEGRVKAVEVRIVADCGAYHTRATPGIAALTGIMIGGVYDIAHLKAEATGVFTNKIPVEPYRGAGRPEATFLIERTMDVLAQRLHLDPAEIRRRNFIPVDGFPYRTASGLQYDSGDYHGALEQALHLVDYAKWRRRQSRCRRQGGRLLGIGLASYVEICGFGPWETGAVRLLEDGRVEVLTGSSPHGQGHATSWAQIAAETLQRPLSAIEVKHGDTALLPRGIGTFGSRSAAVGGSAILLCAEQVREGARQIAAHLLEAAAVDIRLQDGRFQVAGVPERGLSWEEIAVAAYGKTLPAELRQLLSRQDRFEPASETYPFGVHVCVVEISAATGQVEILRYLSLDDCGRVINPLLVEGQVHGGIAQGIGQALQEEARYDAAGNLLTGSLLDYAVPRSHQLPSFEAHRTETPTPLNPLGVKGIGEAATVGSTAAVVNAVVDALAHRGVTHLDPPLTPEKVWRALHGAGHS